MKPNKDTLTIGVELKRCDDCERGDCTQCIYKGKYEEMMSTPNSEAIKTIRHRECINPHLSLGADQQRFLMAEKVGRYLLEQGLLKVQIEEGTSATGPSLITATIQVVTPKRRQSNDNT